MTFADWLRKDEMAGTGAVYDGSRTYDKKRDWNWWGAPETTGMSQGRVQKRLRSQVRKQRK